MPIASDFGRWRSVFAAAPHRTDKKTTKYFDFLKDKSEMKLATPLPPAPGATDARFILTTYIAIE